MTHITNSELPRFTQFFTAVVYTIFVCSVAYNYGYFMALDISIYQLPISASDIINSAFIWTPTATIIVLFELMLIFFLFPSSSKEQKNNNTERVGCIKKIKMIFASVCQNKFFERILDLVVLLGAFWVLLQGQVFDSLLPIATLICSIWLYIVNKIFIKIRSQDDKKNLRLKMFVLLTPIIIGALFVYGYDDAIKKAFQKKPDSVIYLQVQKTNKFNAVILRNFEKGALLKEVDNNYIMFLPWQFIHKMDINYKKHFFTGLICSWGKKCPSSMPHFEQLIISD